MEEAIRYLANGLLRHPRNQELRDRIQSGKLTTRAFYQQLLYLVYRFLFLMVAEERNLLTNGGTASTYREYYSVARLRLLADQPLTAPERFDDLWLGLQTLFMALRDEQMAAALGVPPLNGQLFEDRDLDRTSTNNRDLLLAVRAFSSFTPPGEHVRRRVNYSALDVEELGSVYESLLDYKPAIGPDPLYGMRFDLVLGEARRSTGSYYTDRTLVNELVTAALVPVIEEKLREAGVLSTGGRRRGTGPLADPNTAEKLPKRCFPFAASIRPAATQRTLSAGGGSADRA